MLELDRQNVRGWPKALSEVGVSKSTSEVLVTSALTSIPLRVTLGRSDISVIWKCLDFAFRLLEEIPIDPSYGSPKACAIPLSELGSC